MEVLKQRYSWASDSLSRLSESLKKIEREKSGSDYKDFRDSLIHRFEFSLDTFWKFIKDYLQKDQFVRVEVPSPRKVFRACADNKLISNEEFEALSKAVEDRNLTSHTYNEELAERIRKDIPAHYKVMKAVLDRFSI